MLSAGAPPSVWLPPGVLHAGAAPCVITTLLGSCVAVCLWCPTPRLGGMNHFLLPRAPEREGSPRYGDTSLTLLHSRLIALGARGLVARIYGGAAINGIGAMKLGEQNVLQARHWLADQGIPILEEDVLGTGARRIALDVATGEVTVTTVRTA